MRDHQLGWYLPALPLGPALRTERPTAKDTSVEDFERGDHKCSMPTNAGEVWRDGVPAAAGWYMVGGNLDNFSKTIGAFSDGSAWCMWVGLIDYRTNRVWRAGVTEKHGIKWLRRLTDAECTYVRQAGYSEKSETQNDQDERGQPKAGPLDPPVVQPVPKR